MPATSRIICWLRDVLVLDLPSLPTQPRPTMTRTAIVFDPDADLRILDVLIALYYRDRQICSNVIGLAESRGRITCWYGDPKTFDRALISIQSAAHVALWPFDHWTVEPLVLAPMREDGTVDRANLPERDLLRAVPERYKLGLVTP